MAETKQTEKAVTEKVVDAAAGAQVPAAEQVVQFFKKYQLWFIVGGLAILGLVAWMLLRGGKDNKKEMTAQRDLAVAKSYADADSFGWALKGDTSGSKGLETIIKNNSGTQAAKEASLTAGYAYLSQGDTKKAIASLENAGGFGPSIEARRLSLLGDAWSTQGTAGGTVNKSDCSKAIGYYEDAVDAFADDDNNAAFYLFKAAQLFEVMGDNAKAKEAYLKIKDKYSSTVQASQVEKYLGKLGVEN
jgi:tetratricopeptide (TPR) repeat protein